MIHSANNLKSNGFMIGNINEQTGNLNSSNELQITSKNNPVRNQNLQIKVITSIQEFKDLEADWDSLVEESSVTIFQTFEWNRIWWKYFGSGNDLFIVTIFDDDLLIGVMPFFIDSVTLAGHEIYSALRFLGSTVSDPRGEDLKGLLPYSDYLDAIVRPGFEDIFFHTFIEYLSGTHLPYHQIILDEVPEHGTILNHLVPLFESHQIDLTVSEASVCVGITLAECWQKYLSDLSKRSRYNVRRFLKKAHKSEYKVFDIERIQCVHQMGNAFEKLVTLHQQRWNEIGYPGTFAERRFYEFMKEVTAQFAKKGWAEFRVAKSVESKEDIAVDLLFKFKDTVFLSQRAFDINSELNTHGPGNVLLYQGVKDAINEGYQSLDFMRGKESYKFRSANEVRKNKTVTITNPDRYSSFNNTLIRKIIVLRRRLAFEKDAVQLLFGEKTLNRGLRDYFAFVQRRFSAKFSSSHLDDY